MKLSVLVKLIIIIIIDASMYAMYRVVGANFNIMKTTCLFKFGFLKRLKVYLLCNPRKAIYCFSYCLLFHVISIFMLYS